LSPIRGGRERGSSDLDFNACKLGANEHARTGREVT
jgi:hypothetical protein